MSRRLRGLPDTTDIKSGSGTSSISSGRLDRPTRSSLRQEESTTKSLTPQSSSNDPEVVLATAEPQTRQTRLQRRGNGGVDDADDQGEDDDQNEDDDADGEEVTRCVCGKDEYPGAPVPIVETGRGHQSRESQRNASLTGPESGSEDGGFFIQCDTCHVWQHGGCVGIMQESANPANYYCERCRPDLHKVQSGLRGQRYSHYVPLTESSHMRTPGRTSRARSGDSIYSIEDGRPPLANMSAAKRRSTMNSRAAFDEEEMLRKAIEESKGDGSTVAGSNGNRKSKRARDEDSDGTKQDTKRRKTNSESQTPPSRSTEGAGDGSDDDNAPGSRSRFKKTRTAAAQVQREKEVREREIEKEQEKIEAATRRKERAGRRRADESEPPEDLPRPNVTSRSAATAKIRPQTATKAPPAPNLTTSNSHKKKPAAKKSKVGRNQYTKDRDSATDKKESPRASNSRGSDDGTNGQEGNGPIMLINGSKPSKPKHMNPNRTSITDLRKRAAGILEYITRTQVEMAGRSTSKGKESNELSAAAAPPAKINKPQGVNGSSKLSSQVDKERIAGVGGVDVSKYQDLTSLQMMDVLTRELVLWQKDFGKYGDKS